MESENVMESENEPSQIDPIYCLWESFQVEQYGKVVEFHLFDSYLRHISFLTTE